MRPTWIVLGLVVGLGAVAYVRLRQRADETTLSRNAAPKPPAAAEKAPGAPAASEREPASPPLAKTEPRSTLPPDETEAAQLVARVEERRRAGDVGGADALEKRLDEDLKDTVEARRHALGRGLALAKEAAREDRPRDARVPLADRARRDLTRALVLPEMFGADGSPTDRRRATVATIASMNALVMTWPKGLPGVTTTYDVKHGDSPLRIVSREKLPYGPNALLFWNHGGNLDPTRLRAGERLVIPVEPLEVRVDRARHLLGVYVGGVLAKEFHVGVGKPATPTHPGSYEVKDKYLNPDWHVPPELQPSVGKAVVPYGDSRNELGDAWIPISSVENPTGYGIHGTIRPETVGTDCSNGCVRLRNAEAVEMTSWVRTAKGDGAATRVLIR
jgi:lipoprotein-anchoring transpeptidase ErfK/SrfK